MTFRSFRRLAALLHPFINAPSGNKGTMGIVQGMVPSAVAKSTYSLW
jgi:hypothetical protein